MDFATIISAIDTDVTNARRQKFQKIATEMAENGMQQDAASMKKLNARVSRAEVKKVEAETLYQEADAKIGLISAKTYSWIINNPGTVAAAAAAAVGIVAAYKNKKRTESAREEVNNLWQENAKLREELREKEMKEADARMRRSFNKRRCNRK